MGRHLTPGDRARFAADDDELLVAAAFACRVCLRVPEDIALLQSAEGSVAACRCAWCDCAQRIRLTPDQSLRLRLAPPRRPRVVLG